MTLAHLLAAPGPTRASQMANSLTHMLQKQTKLNITKQKSPVL